MNTETAGEVNRCDACMKSATACAHQGRPCCTLCSRTAFGSHHVTEPAAPTEACGLGERVADRLSSDEVVEAVRPHMGPVVARMMDGDVDGEPRFTWYCRCGANAQPPYPHPSSDARRLTLEQAEREATIHTLAAARTALLAEAAEPGPGTAHVEGWAPGNLQHHLIFAHHAQPSDVPYDGPLDQMHRDLHAAAIPEIEGQR